MMKFFLSLKILFLFISCIVAVTTYAQTIKIGMSAPFTGPTKALGLELRKGAHAYFEHFNKSAKSPKIELISYDDGYEPSRTIANTKQLIKQDKVFGLFSYVGTPTSKAVLPLVQRHSMLYFSPYTGAEFLRQPVNKQIFNIRGSYYQEADLLVSYLSKHYSLKKVALFIQADAFGIAASKGYIDTLTRQGIRVVKQVRYKRNSTDIGLTADRLSAANIDAIFCVGTYQPVAQLINSLRAKASNIPVAVLSFASAETLKQHLKSPSNTFITTTMPNPHYSSLAIVQQYRTTMEGQALTHESLEGYINAALFSAITSKLTVPYSRKQFIDIAENTSFDIGGIKASYSSTNHSLSLSPILNKITTQGLISIP